MVQTASDKGFINGSIASFTASLTQFFDSAVESGRSLTALQNAARPEAPRSSSASRLGRLSGLPPSARAVISPAMTASRSAFAAPYISRPRETCSLLPRPLSEATQTSAFDRSFVSRATASGQPIPPAWPIAVQTTKIASTLVNRTPAFIAHLGFFRYNLGWTGVSDSHLRQLPDTLSASSS